MKQRIWVLPLLAILALVTAQFPVRPVQAQVGVEQRFAAYYAAHDGVRLLGYPLRPLSSIEGFPAQYFDKGRIEDHRGAERDPRWGIMFGRLTAELMECAPFVSVSGTRITYAELRQAGLPERRVPPPPEFRGGAQARVLPVVGDTVFIPVDPLLRPAPGYYVPRLFWDYMNRPDLFPDGWLHDTGLPLTPALWTDAYKASGVRRVMLQAFERTVLTYDPLNPPAWQIERANVGMDILASGCFAPSRHGLISPLVGANVTVPLYIAGYIGKPGEQVIARLRRADGTELSQRFTLLRDTEGKGLLTGNLEWVNMLNPPDPPTQPAVLEVTDLNGQLLGRSGVTVLGPGDPAARTVLLYWTIKGADVIVPQHRRVVIDRGLPRGVEEASLSEIDRLTYATLQELLHGPPIISQVGFATAIPTPEEVLNYPGRGPGWGWRVYVISVHVANGVATVRLSPELLAYGNDAQRAQLIREQITYTLLQFPEVRAVNIRVVTLPGGEGEVF